MLELIEVVSDEEYDITASLFKEYAEWLNVDLAFQHFENELKVLKVMYATPEGGILLCKKEGTFIGCAAIRKFDAGVAELKRMFVKTEYHKMGIGQLLLDKAIKLATKANYKTIRLDTLDYMLPAINLYKKNGFYEIEAYYHNPNSTAIYFELRLNP